MTRHFPIDFQTAFPAPRDGQVVGGTAHWSAHGSADVTVIKPSELGLLGHVLETHCRTYGIRSEEGRGSVAQSLMAHFRSGVVEERDLLALLEREDRPLPKHAGRGGAGL
jgi:hypothetical protein